MKTTEEILTALLNVIEPNALPLYFNLEGGYQWDEDTQTNFWNPIHDQVYGTPLSPISESHQFTFYLIGSTISETPKLNRTWVTTSPYGVLRIPECLEYTNLTDPKYWDTLLTYGKNLKILVPSPLLMDILLNNPK